MVVADEDDMSLGSRAAVATWEDLSLGVLFNMTWNLLLWQEVKLPRGFLKLDQLANRSVGRSTGSL